MTTLAESIPLPGTRSDAELKMCQMLISGLISSFVIEFIDTKDGMKVGDSISIKTPGTNVHVRYTLGRGKLLFGLATEIASEAQHLSSLNALIPLLTKIISVLKQGTDSHLSRLIYEDMNKKLWGELPDISKQAYTEKLNSTLLGELQIMLNDIRSSLQALSDFDWLWERAWPLLFGNAQSLAKNSTLQYSYMLTIILRLISILETRSTVQVDMRPALLVNIAASIVFVESMWISQNPPDDTGRKRLNESSLDPFPKRVAPNDNWNASDNIDSSGSSTLDIAQAQPVEKAVSIADTGSASTFSVNNQYNQSSTAKALSILVQRLITGLSTETLVYPLVDLSQADSDLVKQIYSKKKQLERALSGCHGDDTTELSLFPAYLNLSIPPFIWNSAASAQDVVIMKLKQIYYKLLDRRYQNMKENVKYVDDIIIRDQISMRKILEESIGNSSIVSLLAPNPPFQLANALEKAQQKQKPLPKEYTLALELSEWSALITTAACSEQLIRPTARLDSFFPLQEMKDVMVSTLNETFGRILYFYKDSQNKKPLVDSEGAMSAVVNHHDELTVEAFLRGTLYLFYYNLEAILVYEASRTKLPLSKLLGNASFHKALYTFTCICLYRATGGPVTSLSKTAAVDGAEADNEKSGALFLFHWLNCPPIDFFRVSEGVVRALVKFDRPLRNTRSSTVIRESCGIPSILFLYIRQEEDFLLESNIWASNQSIDGSPDTIWHLVQKLGPLWFRKMLDSVVDQSQVSSEFMGLIPFYSFASYIFRRVLVISSKRISSLCTRLSILSPCPAVTKMWRVFLYFIRNKIEIIKDRHLDQIILCTVYGVCKVLGYTSITFVQIVEEYISLRKNDIGEPKCVAIVRDVGTGNIVQFYNSVYVPAIKDILLSENSGAHTAVAVCDSTASVGSPKNINFTIQSELPYNMRRQPGSITQVHSFGSVSQLYLLNEK